MASQKYNELFDIIDSNKDGYIDMDELEEAFNERGIVNAKDEVQIFFSRSDLDRNKVLERNEFINYMTEHEREIQGAFNTIDVNKDGLLDLEEVINAFKSRGICVSKEQIEKIVKRIDADGNHVIDWNEWREFLLFRSANSIVTDHNLN